MVENFRKNIPKEKKIEIMHEEEIHEDLHGKHDKFWEYATLINSRKNIQIAIT